MCLPLSLVLLCTHHSQLAVDVLALLQLLVVCPNTLGFGVLCQSIFNIFYLYVLLEFLVLFLDLILMIFHFQVILISIFYFFYLPRLIISLCFQLSFLLDLWVVVLDLAKLQILWLPQLFLLLNFLGFGTTLLNFDEIFVLLSFQVADSILYLLFIELCLLNQQFLLGHRRCSGLWSAHGLLML